MARKTKAFLARSRAAKRGWVPRSWIKANGEFPETTIKQGEPVTISWAAHGPHRTIGRVQVPRHGEKIFYPRETTSYTLTVRGYGRTAIRRVTVHVEEEEPEVITRRAYKPGRTSHTKREQRVEIVSRGPLREDLSNVTRVTVGTRVYTRRQDIEALSYLIHGALNEGTPF